MSHTDVAEKRVLDFSTGKAPAGPTLPMMVRLMSVMGTEATPGTEVVGGSYAPQSVVFTAAAGDPASASNDAVVRFESMPAGDVVGIEVWDSAATPVRWRTQAFAAPVTFAAGDPAEFAAGELTLTED